MPSVKREVWRKCSSSDLIHELDGHNLTSKLDGRGEVSTYYNLHIIHLLAPTVMMVYYSIYIQLFEFSLSPLMQLMLQVSL